MDLELYTLMKNNRAGYIVPDTHSEYLELPNIYVLGKAYHGIHIIASIFIPSKLEIKK